MKKNYFLILSAALALSSLGAFADGGPGTGTGGTVDGKGGPGRTRQITMDDFKFRCAHPEETDIQRAPQNIRIQCTDVQKSFVADAPGVVALAGQDQVSAALFSDKFNVDSLSKGITAIQDTGSCMRFKEVQQTLTVERPLSRGYHRHEGRHRRLLH